MKTLREARELGLTRYFTGKPCNRGHITERIVSNRRCAQCLLEESSAWKKANREKATATSKEWRKKNPERVREIKRDWNAANPDWQKARSRKWFLANKERANQQHYAWAARNPEKAKGLIEAWRLANPDKAAAISAKRRAALLKRTPAWSDLKAIEQIYQEAREFREVGLEVDVDHMIPLQGELVSGLHVPMNLRICLSSVNRSKSNQFSI